MTCFPLLYPNSLTDDCDRVTFKLIKDWIVWVHLSKPPGTEQHGLCTRGLAGTESALPVQRSPGGAGLGAAPGDQPGPRSAPSTHTPTLCPFHCGCFSSAVQCASDIYSFDFKGAVRGVRA